MIRMTEGSTLRLWHHAAAPHGTDEVAFGLDGAGHEAFEEEEDPRAEGVFGPGRRRPVDSGRHGCAAGEHGATGTHVVIEDRIHRRVKSPVIDDALQLF